jgi:hypothetical protein
MELKTVEDDYEPCNCQECMEAREKFARGFQIGETIKIKIPQRYVVRELR